MSVDEVWQSGRIQRAWTTPDAVVVVPGIMGSELYDTVDERTIWGMKPGMLVSALVPGGHGLTRLRVTGEPDRVKPVGLIRFPAYLPWLKGVEPYSKLVGRLREIVRHPTALTAFPYDWRLPVAHNAVLLADAVDEHLTDWRARSGRSDAKVVLVAHSMGGLLCQAMVGISGAADDVRATITLGTPFDGAAKAALMLAESGGHLHRKLSVAARTMPGVYDLLPTYRCVDRGDTVEPLTIDDVVGLGGWRELAESAAQHQQARAVLRLSGHRAMIGIEQPTLSSLILDAGTARATTDTFDPHADGELKRDRHGRLLRFPGRGDATVPRNSALPPESDPMVLAQQHTTLAHSDEAIAFVRDVILHGHATERPRLGEGDVGLVLPDVVAPGEQWSGELTGIDPLETKVTITNSEKLEDLPPPVVHRHDGETRFTTTVDRPGLYRVRVDGGSTPVVQYMLAVQ